MTTTQTLPSLANKDDVRLATECIEWHGANCAICSTGGTCRAAAENMAFLEGHGFNERQIDHTPSATFPRTSKGTVPGSSRTAATRNPASAAQERFLTKLLAERDVAGVTELQNSVLARGLKARIADNLSKRQASDMIDILTQCPLQTAASPAAAAVGDGPTERQVAFFASLLRDRVALPGHTIEAFKASTRRGASQMIDAMRNSPLRSEQWELAAGIYRIGQEIFKVQKAVHGSGQMVAKLLVVDTETKTGEFVYQGLAKRFIPQGAAPMGLEEAKAFGKLYGVCCNCGRTLTDEGSIEAGIGPVCAKKFA